jgi:hypothetical protein
VSTPSSSVATEVHETTTYGWRLLISLRMRYAIDCMRWSCFVLEFTSWLAYPLWIVKLDSDYSWAGPSNFLLLGLLRGVTSCLGSLLATELVERDVIVDMEVLYL